MALTRITPEVLDVTKTSIQLTGDQVVGGIRNYVDAKIAAIPASTGTPNAVSRAGDTMTGALTLSGAPTAGLHAATKNYVDATAAGVVTGKVSISGDTMTGALTLSGAPSASNHAATKSYVDTAAGGRVSKAGDTMSGALTVNAAISAGGLLNAWAGLTVNGAPLTVNDVATFGSRVQAKTGAGAPNNTNNCGYSFAGDPDTGMFNPADGVLNLVVNGDYFMATSAGSHVGFQKQIRTPKGLANNSDSSYNGGYAFAGDGDTGLFADGGNVFNSSDLVLSIDGLVAARFKSQMASFAGNGWTRLSSGVILQWGAFDVYDTGGSVQSNITWPMAFPTGCFFGVAVIGNGLNGSVQNVSIEGMSATGASVFSLASAGWRTYRVFVLGW